MSLYSLLRIEIMADMVTKIGDLLASITGEPSPKEPSIPLPLKRKVPDADPLRRPIDKLQRSSSGSLAATVNNSRPTSSSSKPTGVNTPTSKPQLGANGRTQTSTVSSTFKNGQPTPPPTDAPAKPPKKGSFAEIMARGKAVQATRGPQIGKIQHKRIEKLPSKREREEMKAMKGAKLAKNLGPNGKFADKMPGLVNVDRKLDGGKKKQVATEPEKKVKKAALATTGYSGTARPKPGSSKSSASRPPSSSRYDRDRSSSQRYTYASEDEEDEDDIEEQEDYYSDASSDMEAAAFEVDDEEELAARIARKEDAQALAEENRLKREKMEKKKRLMAMAAKRR